MQDKVPYEYAIIRVVPRVERGEFVNVGVILFSKKLKYIGMKYKVDEGKVKALSSVVSKKMVDDYLRGWELVCQGSPEGGPIGELELPVRFRWLTASRSSIIQSSPVHPGLTNDPLATLEVLFERFVL